MTDGGSHFIHGAFRKMLAKYDVNHRIASPYCQESQHNLKFSYAHQDASMESTSNEGKGVHLHTLVDRERKRSNERG